MQDGKVEFSFHQPDFVSEEDVDSVSTSANRAVAPMPGILEKILVKEGDVVKQGESIFILIAMKMEYVVKATRDAKIEEVVFKVGDNVAKDATIVKFAEK